MKLFNYAIALGIASSLLGSACGSRKQYGGNTPPPNPAPETAVITPTVSIPTGDDAQQGGSGDGTSLSDPALASTPQEVTGILKNWFTKPILWNESAGNIEINKTDINQWSAIINKLYTVAPFSLYFFPPNGAYNLKVEGDTLIAGSINGIAVSIGYEGALEANTDSGVTQSVRLGESLVEKGFFAADKAGSDLNLTVPDSSTRGREFFRRFYNSKVKVDEGGDDFDCFAAGYCSYFFTPTNEYYALIYNSPRSEFGYLFISRENNVLTELSFQKPELPAPGLLAAPTTGFELLSASFIDQQTKAPLLALGEKADRFQSLELPKSTWIPQAASLVVQYQGADFTFRKENRERLTDFGYTAPEATDTLTAVNLNYVYTGQVYIAMAGGAPPIALPLIDDKRNTWTRAEHVKYLKGYGGLIAGVLQSKGAKIIQSRLRNENDNRQNAAFIYTVTATTNGKTREYVLQTSRRSPYLFISVTDLADYESKALALSEAADPKGSQSKIRSFGDFVIGADLNLSDVDLELRDQATLNLPSGEKLRVSLKKEDLSTRKYFTADGILSSVTDNVMSFWVHDLYVSFKSSACLEGGGTCYKIVALRTYSFFNSANPAPTSAKGSLTLCGKELPLDMLRKDFEAQFANLAGCPLATQESDAASMEKSVYYLPSENAVVYFGGDDGQSINSIGLYLGGNQ